MTEHDLKMHSSRAERWETPIFDSGWSPFGSAHEGSVMRGVDLGPWMTRRSALVCLGIAGLFCMAAVPVAEAVVSSFVAHLLGVVLEGLGIALLSSAILAFTVENWLRFDLSKDVFLTTIGYRLPDDFRVGLKSEILRLSSYDFLCDWHLLKVTIEPIEGTSYVRVTSNGERRIRNISEKSLLFSGMAHIDYWGLTERSQITTCSVTLEEGGNPVSFTRTETLSDLTVRAETEPVTVPSKKRVIVSTTTTEMMHDNDDLSYSYAFPTLNPMIEAPPPKGFMVEGGFHKDAPFVTFERHTPRQKLEGVLYPHQRIRIRWWPSATPNPDDLGS